MTIKCADIPDFNYSHPVTLVAGIKGSNRAITWVHYMEDVKFMHFINGGELLVFSGILMKSERDFHDYIINAYRHNAAGVAVKTSREYIRSIPDEITELCDTLEFPLFQMPEEMQILEFSQIVCRDILDKKNNQESMRKLTLDIIYNKSISETIISKARRYGYNDEHDHYGAVVKVIIGNDDSSEEFLAHTADGCISEFFSGEANRLISSVCDNEIILIIDMEPGNDIRSVVERLASYLEKNLKLCGFTIGIGPVWSKLIECRTSISKARYALNFNSADIGFSFYDDLRLQKLLFDIPNQEELVILMEQILGDIVINSNEKNNEMYNTIETFIDCNCDIAKTAKKLYIHVNTLRYRLKKIESILGISFENFDDLFNIKLAVSIKKYLSTK